ncbi:MAG: inositol monophosphatase family protein [Pseudomonadota bacterium]
MHPLINIATSAARRAGDLLVRYFDRLDTLNVQTKGRGDFVSEVDRAVEREVSDIILKAYPHHGIIGEEGGERPGQDCDWIIDPLDGTRNYLNGYPHFCVSIAVRERGRIEHGVIYDPLLQEMFTASRGAGATLNSRRIRVSTTTRYDESIVCTGLATHQESQLAVNQAIEAALTREAVAMRRSGSAALDLAYVSAGRLDAYWQYGLKLWDLAAGVLMVREAGGMVSSPDGRETYLDTGDVLATNARLFRPTLQLIQRERRHLSPDHGVDPAPSTNP